MYDVLTLSTGQKYKHKLFEIIEWIEENSMFTSTGLTIMIALDRYDCICRPQRRFFNATRGKAAALISFLAASVQQLQNSPRCLLMLTFLYWTKFHWALH
jgi:hypothetical protein